MMKNKNGSFMMMRELWDIKDKNKNGTMGYKK